MKILVTGAAGFIGTAVCLNLLKEGNTIVGLDNLNDYYDPALKFMRLKRLGIKKEEVRWNEYTRSDCFNKFCFTRLNLEDSEAIAKVFKEGEFDAVINLAAQAGVRYSIENPGAYIKSNIEGFVNVLEGCRNNKVKHLVYASSSSVYGLNGKIPFSEHDGVDHPVSLYAATKKSNELMAHTYSELFGLPTTGLRFFTVYGPWGRPDMSPFLFIDAIINGRKIKVFNKGDMWRDFTYIDDVAESVKRIVSVIPVENPGWNAAAADPATSKAPYRLYNVGNGNPVKLMDYIECIEKATGEKAEMEFLPMQPGDVYKTYADSSDLAEATGFKPSTDLSYGIGKTVEWMRQYLSGQDMR